MSIRLFGMITTSASSQYTIEALKTFFDHTILRPEDRFILIDNDGDWQKPFDHPAIEIKINNNQLGFAENANYLVRQALEMQSDLIMLNNDLIFTTDWLTPLEQFENSISSPLSNREVQYTLSVQVVKTQFQQKTTQSSTVMQLEQYMPDKFAIQAIAEAHRANNSGHWSVIVMPFFCVRIPLKILKAVGLFDEEFGRGGAEDYDYALRARLAGFDICYAVGSWILHFYGKSSWSGVEKPEETKSRESRMMSHFETKWGYYLKKLIFEEKEHVATELGLKIPDAPEGYPAFIRSIQKIGLGQNK